MPYLCGTNLNIIQPAGAQAPDLNTKDMAKLIITLKEGMRYTCSDNCPLVKWCGGVRGNQDCSAFVALGLMKPYETITKVVRKD